MRSGQFACEREALVEQRQFCEMRCHCLTWLHLSYSCREEQKSDRCIMKSSREGSRHRLGLHMLRVAFRGLYQ